MPSPKRPVPLGGPAVCASLAVATEHADIHGNLANTLYKLGLLPDALEHYRHAIQLKSDDADLHLNFGIVLFKANQMSDAIEQLNAALKLKPDLAEAHYNLGNALLRSLSVAGGH